MGFQYYTYDKEQDQGFAAEIKRQTRDYFEQKGTSKYADGRMVFKTFVMISLFVVPWALMITGIVDSLWLMYALSSVMGLAMAGIGMGIMHDAIHGSYSQQPKVNRWLGLSMNLIGGNAYVWHMQHNVLHHTYPNVDEVDDDIDLPFILRMSPHQPRLPFHRFQHLYVWVLYAFATIFWITSKDFVMLGKYKERGMLKAKNEFLLRFLNILVWKVVYFAYMLVLPLLVIDLPWYHIIGMFVLMHLVAGIFLSVIFQPAHVFEGSEYLKPASKEIERSWYAYQLQTTTNFKLNSLLSWWSGGLNYQIEHHLFPHVCHVHYPELSVIVKSAAEKHGIPYNEQGGLWGALRGHVTMLRNLGQPEPSVQAVNA